MRKINDHSSWMGGASKGSVFPEGVKVKKEMSAEGAGKMARYADTSEAVKAEQDKNISKAKAHPMKDGYRH